jgi:hypothetical protein
MFATNVASAETRARRLSLRTGSHGRARSVPPSFQVSTPGRAAIEAGSGGARRREKTESGRVS